LNLRIFFTRIFFTSTASGEGAKKKYALLSEDGSMKITGFEQVRRDWSPIAKKKTQKKVLRKVLEDKVTEAADIVKETIQKLKRQRNTARRSKDLYDFDQTSRRVWFNRSTR